MSKSRTIGLALAVVCILSAAPAGAQDAPKADGPATSMFKSAKALPLAVKDGKASYAGELTDKDAVVRMHYFKVFSVKLEAGKTYRIEHVNNGKDAEFDPLLFLEDASGKVLAMDDDSAGKLNARIIFFADNAGTYRLIATTVPPNQVGKFKLTVAPGTADDEKIARLTHLVSTFATQTKAEQKKIAADALKMMQAKGTKLSVSDARLAMQLASAAEDGDIDLAKSTYSGLEKIFSHADNPQFANVVRSFKSSLKKLDMIGKELVISGKTVDGKEFDLKKLKGKVVLVDFWATWCGPCVAEMPNIEKAYAKYHGKGFEVIGVSLDRDDEAITKFAEARKMKWGSINVEDSKALADRYDVNAIPFPVLVDQAGNVVSLRARGENLEQLLERLLGSKK